MAVRTQVRLLVTSLLLWFQFTGGVGATEKNITAFIHANLIPMTRETVLADQTVLVGGRQITAVGPSGRMSIPPDAQVIDCRGAYLMPGLADMHMHVRYNWMSDTWPVSPLKLYIANGVTTIRSFGPRGKTGRYFFKWRKEIESGRLVGPVILGCGPQLRGHFKKDPVQIAVKQKYRRFDFLKIYSYVTKQEFQSIVAAAKRVGLYTAGHIPFQVGLDGVLAEGLDEIAHVEELLWEFSGLDRDRYYQSEGEWMAYAIQKSFERLAPYLNLSPQATKQKLAYKVATVVGKLNGKSIPFCTTMVVDDIIVQKLFHHDQFLTKAENRYLPAGYMERFSQGREKHQQQFKGGEAFAPFKYLLDKQLLAALKKAGVPLLLSTDAGTGGMGIVPGFSVHDELEILVETGFSPYEAIAAGTVVASKIVNRMNGQDNFGIIAPGKRADLILLRGNPLANITNTRKISGVMAAGRWYDQSAIESMLRQ